MFSFITENGLLFHPVEYIWLTLLVTIFSDFGNFLNELSVEFVSYKTAFALRKFDGNDEVFFIRALLLEVDCSVAAVQIRE